MHATQVNVREEQPPPFHLCGILKMWILITGNWDQVSGACGWGAKTQTLKVFNKIFAATKDAASTSVLKSSVQFWDAWLPASQHLGAWGAAGGVLEGPGNQAYRRQMPQKGPWGPLHPAFSSKYKTSVPRNVLHNFPCQKKADFTLLFGNHYKAKLSFLFSVLTCQNPRCVFWRVTLQLHTWFPAVSPGCGTDQRKQTQSPGTQAHEMRLWV